MDLCCSPVGWRAGVDVSRMPAATSLVFGPSMMRYTSTGRWIFFNSTLPMRANDLRDFVVYVIEHLLCYRDSTRIGQWLDPCGDVHAIAHNVVAAAQDIAQMNANSNLQLSVCLSAQVAPGQCLLEFDGAIHRGHRAGELNEKAVAYRFYLLSLMFEERGPQESAVFIE